MHLLVDISAHGLGHLAQTAPVLNALKVLLPDLRLTVRSLIPRTHLARRIAVDFAHVPEARDFGLMMHNAVDVDLAATAQRYREFHTDWPQRVAAEAEWQCRHRVDAVLSNVAYLPLAAAAAGGLPAAGLCSLNWADLFAHYLCDQTWAAGIHAQMVAAYNSATGFLRVTPGLPMADFERRNDIAPIAGIGRRDRSHISGMLDLNESERWLLLAMGGMEFRLPLEKWPRTPGMNWLVPGDWKVSRPDVRSIDAPGLAFTDILASVDAVITKPGYGTFVEAACAGIPILYVERDDWPETAHFAAWLAVHARSEKLPREQLLAGNFFDALHRLWSAPAPARPRPEGADQAANWLAAGLAPVPTAA